MILDHIHEVTGWGNPLRPYCEDEFLKLVEVVEHPDGLREVLVRYTFNEDGFSQYDKSHQLEGRFMISPNLEIVSAKLEETYTGPATTNDPYRQATDPGTDA